MLILGNFAMVVILIQKDLVTPRVSDCPFPLSISHCIPYSELYLKGFPGSSAGKVSTCNAGDPGSIPGSGRSSGEGTGYPLQYSWASLVAQLVKNLPAMWEIWVQSLGWEDLLEKRTAYPLQYSGLENSMDYIVHVHN